jgi:hypothetical protein
MQKSDPLLGAPSASKVTEQLCSVSAFRPNMDIILLEDDI